MQFLSTTHIVINENLHLLQLPVRNFLWGLMMEHQGDIGQALPIAIVWWDGIPYGAGALMCCRRSLLESCVAEGTSRFYIRIMESKVSYFPTQTKSVISDRKTLRNGWKIVLFLLH